jgi:WD40 repeat protein/serine/threonine protein kinase
MSLAMNDPSERELAIFSEARQLSADQRAAYLAQACTGDESLRRRVEELLQAGVEAGAFLELPAAILPGQGAPIRAPQVGGERAGDKIGHYKLLQQIGEGGCGVVYMAEQEEPVRRRVALKVIKLGMDTKQIIGRFEAERQALAMMDHPNIARVFDAGATATGRPYFVMELVRGIKINEYCDEHHLSTRERLELFILVCQAIQHAHQKGIIHRDIKPSNILVTINDGVPVPKVIDFGIAKATQGRLTDQTLFTAFEQFLGTPAYMSPEQAVMTSLDIDTRSDIYSLGVILYELLTGKTPFDTQELLRVGLDEMRRTIREREPPRPSNRLSTMLEAEATTTARLRRTEVPKLVSALKGDLDWIAMKCLEKDRGRRYETANGLARDIQRYLDHQPVLARPPGSWYLLTKALRRNRLAFSAAAAVAVAVLAGLGTSALMYLRERNERHKADELTRQAMASETRARNEAGRAEEALALSRRTLDASDLAQAVHFSSIGAHAEALPYLVRILKRTPANDAALTRLTTLLTYQSWLLPLVTVTQTNSIIDAEFSPDGERIVAGSWDQTARVWDAHTGVPITPPLGHQKALWTAKFSPDGKWVLTASQDNTARVWDSRTGEGLGIPLQHGGPVEHAEFSPDSTRVVTASRDTTAMVWDALTSQAVTPPLQHPDAVVWAKFSPDGRRVVTGSEKGTARIWDARTGTLLVGPIQHSSRVNAAEFSPDGKWLATASYDGTASVWDSQTGRLIAGPMRHSQHVLSARFSPDGNRIVTASWDKTARVWEASTGRALTDPLPHASTVNSAEFSPDGTRILSASEDGTAKIWDARTGRLLAVPSRQGGGLLSARFSPDGHRIVTGSRDSSAMIWDALDRRPLNLPFGHTSYVRSASFNRDGSQVVTSSEDNTARVWDVDHGRPVTPALKHEGIVNCARFSPNGEKVVTAAFDGAGRIFDARSGKTIAVLQHDAAVWDARFSPDAEWVVTASSDRTARVWNAKDGSPGIGPLMHDGEVLAAGFSPDGTRIVTTSTDNLARIWDARNGRLLAQCAGHTAKVVWAEFSSDGERIVTASYDRTARIWDAHNGLPLTSPLNHTDSVLFAQFSSDGKKIVTSSWDHNAQVWDTQTGRALTPRLTHGQSVFMARFSPDDRRILTTSDDFTARLWDAESGLPLSEPFEHGGLAWPGEFSPDGKRFVTGSGDGKVRVWDGAPSGQSCPAWVLLLAEAACGLSVGPNGDLAVSNLDRPAALRQVRQSLEAEPSNNDWTVWGRWFIAEPFRRTISPFSKITFRDYLSRRLEEGTPPSLQEIQALGAVAEAESVHREALAASRARWPNEPSRWQAALSGLLAILARQGKIVEAASIFNSVHQPEDPQNLVINGSFEFGRFVDNSGYKTMVLQPGSGDIAGWIVTGTPGLDLDWLMPQQGLEAQQGNRFLDLTGYHDHPPYDGVSQVIPTVVGREYKVSFAIGSDARWARNFLPAVAVEVTGDASRIFAVSAAGTNRWQTFEFSFTAASTNTTLTFTGANRETLSYIGLDNVRMTAVTNAEPGVPTQSGR